MRTQTNCYRAIRRGTWIVAAVIAFLLFFPVRVASAQSAKKRQLFVDIVNNKMQVIIPGSTVTSEGTTVVYHIPTANYQVCNDLPSQPNFLSSLRSVWFTQFVCTNDTDKRINLDLTAQATVPKADPPSSFYNPSSQTPPPDPPSVVNITQPVQQESEQFFVSERLSIVSGGLAFAICDTFENNMLAVKMPVLTIHIENNVARYDRHPVDGLFSSCNGTVTEPLRTGEVVQITALSTHGHEFRMRIVSAPHTIQRGIGAYQHTVYESGAADLRFKFHDSKEIPAAVRAWLQPTTESLGNTASGVQVPQVREGMSQSEVESVLGVPDLKFDANGSTTYTYSKLGVAVIFTGGKVSQIAHTH
jgi:hypothetical protein